MYPLTVATVFVSAALLFWLQPMVAKSVLPLLGGAPAVWNTCVVFFQAVLLAGYCYAHFTTRWLGRRCQLLLHTAIVWLPLALLPLGISQETVRPWPSATNPVPWLLSVLLVSIGLPFFVLSTTAPLLQKWFASSDHPEAREPYRLYAASNLGSMLALLGYPLLLEPYLHLAEQQLVVILVQSGPTPHPKILVENGPTPAASCMLVHHPDARRQKDGPSGRIRPYPTRSPGRTFGPGPGQAVSSLAA